MESIKYVPQRTASVWMPFEQACDEEFGDADFDSSETAPWDDGETQRDDRHAGRWYITNRRVIKSPVTRTLTLSKRRPGTPVGQKGTKHMSFISGVHRCVVFTGSEDPRCSCSGSTQGNTSLALFPPTPEGTSSSSPVDRSQPLHRESLRPSSDAGISPPPYVAASFISGVHRCVVSTGPEDPCCSCSWSTRGSTPFALFPPTPECTSSSSPVESSQAVRRELLRPSSDTCLVQRPDVLLPLTTRYVNAVRRGSVFRSRRRTQVVLVLSHTRGGTSAALFLRRSDARAVVYRPTTPDHLRLQKKRRRRSCCPVFLCSSASARDVTFGMLSPHMTMGYCSSPIQRDDASMVMSA